MQTLYENTKSVDATVTLLVLRRNYNIQIKAFCLVFFYTPLSVFVRVTSALFTDPFLDFFHSEKIVLL